MAIKTISVVLSVMPAVANAALKEHKPRVVVHKQCSTCFKYYGQVIFKDVVIPAGKDTGYQFCNGPKQIPEGKARLKQHPVKADRSEHNPLPK